MEKIRSSIFLIVISFTVFFAVFYYSVLYASAGQITGEEVYFTHIHNEQTCYKNATGYCGFNHSRRHISGYDNYHCSNCNAMLQHYVEVDNCYCNVVPSVMWQENGYTKCTVCGTIHSTWTVAASEHSYIYRKLVCDMTDGENAAGISISADNQWTNQSVVLRLNKNVLKQDKPNDNITCDWGGMEKTVAENGTYSAQVQNGNGQTVTASITINSIDKVPPSINGIEPDTASMTQDAILITVSASDELSGLAETAFSFDGGSTFSNSNQYSVVEGQEIVCVVRDKAGNSTSRAVKRSDFPYPPPPPPAPKPTPQSGTTSGDSPEVKTNPLQSSANTTPSKNEEVHSKGEATELENKQALGDTEKKEVKKETNTDKRKETGKNSAKEKDTKAGSDTVSEVFSQKESEKEFLLEETEQTEQSGNDKVTIYRMNQNNRATSKSSLGDEDGDLTGNEDQIMQLEESGTAKSEWSQIGGQILNKNTAGIAGILLILCCTFWLIRKFWIQTVLLYCYNGGEDFRKLGLLRLKKNKKEFTLFLPDYLLDEADTPRYRLLIHTRLVKKYKDMDIVLQSEEHKLRQPLEECVDFVL